MDPFNCPTCGSRTWKLIYPEYDRSLDKLVCPNCFKSETPRPTYLHQPMEGAQSKGLTEAKSRIIANRITSPEDKSVVIDRRTGKETQY